jgi:small subunit ribosomal protein S6
MRVYEELFIVKPNAADEEVDQVIEQISQVVSGAGGAVEKTEKWGVRKLAYRVAKHDEGGYVLVLFKSGPQAVKEIERRLRVSDLVLKYLTVRIDEKQRRIDKRRKEREKRAARKPPPAAPMPQAPAAEDIMARGSAPEEEE